MENLNLIPRKSDEWLIFLHWFPVIHSNIYYYLDSETAMVAIIPEVVIMIIFLS